MGEIYMSAIYNYNPGRNN